jgi:Domain of unknown function (DUF4269)
MTFDNIEYLRDENDKQKAAYHTLTDYKIFEKLNDFSPILTGAIPINIDTDESDLDIICYWKSKEEFLNTLTNEFGKFESITLTERIINSYETILANFNLNKFEIEIFGQNRPSKDQESYRHMIIEYEILRARGEKFRQEIVRLKKEGLKTEPAFGKLLGLDGNPYEELLKYNWAV